MNYFKEYYNKLNENIKTSSVFMLLFIFYIISATLISINIYTFAKHNIKLNIDLLPGLAPWFNTKMLPRMVYYIAGTALLGLFFLLALIGVKQNSKQSHFLRSTNYIPVILAEIGIGLLLNASKTGLTSVFVLAVILCFHINPSMLIKPLKVFKNSYWLLLISFSVFIVVIYKNIIINPEIVFNAYYRIPEFYRLPPNYQSEDKKYINTTTLLNDGHAMGVHNKIDIITASDWKNNPACIPVTGNNAKLEELAQQYSITNSFYLGEHVLGISSAKTYQPVLVYKEATLCIFQADGPNPDSVRKANRQMWAQLREAGIRQPKNFRELPLDKNPQSPEIILNFLHDASFNNYFQILARGNLKHQQHAYMPAHEYLLGKPLKEVSNQYGLGLTLAIAGLSKWLSLDGLVDYGVYQRTIPWVGYLSFIIFSLAMFIIFRDIRIAIIPIALWTLTRVMNGFEPFFDSCGWLFTRVLFQPLLLAAIVIYFCNNSKIIRHSLLLFLISQLCLFINFQFGFMASLALFAVYLVAFFIEREIKSLAVSVLILGSILFGAHFYSIGSSPVSYLYLLGLVSLPISSIDIFAYLALFFVFLCMFMHMHTCNSNLKYPFLYTVFFRQLILTYYLWSGMPNHYFTYFAELMLPYVFYGYFLFYEISLFPRLKQAIPAIVMVLMLAPFSYYTKSYFDQEKDYKTNAKKMQIFEWNLPGSHIKSTMNPDFFSDSVELIHKYTPEQQKAIFMISRYDAFMALLSRKYSALPHFDLSPYLATSKEKEAVIHAFIENMPEYIFVDNDINVPAEFDIVPSSLYGLAGHAESKIQLLQAMELQSIYEEIIPSKYEPIEKSQILTVYKKIGSL